MTSDILAFIDSIFDTRFSSLEEDNDSSSSNNNKLSDNRDDQNNVDRSNTDIDNEKNDDTIANTTNINAGEEELNADKHGSSDENYELLSSSDEDQFVVANNRSEQHNTTTSIDVIDDNYESVNSANTTNSVVESSDQNTVVDELSQIPTVLPSSSLDQPCSNTESPQIPIADTSLSETTERDSTLAPELDGAQKRLYDDVNSTEDQSSRPIISSKRKISHDRQPVAEFSIVHESLSNQKVINLSSNVFEETQDVDPDDWKLEESRLIAERIIRSDARLLNNEKLSIHAISGQQSSLRMWWYDAYENSRQGTLYMFGKVFVPTKNKYESCCVSIQNVKQEMYFLPRPFISDYAYGIDMNKPVTLEDVCMEIKQILADELNITNSDDYHLEVCRRKYASYLPDVPSEETDYIKLIINYKQNHGYFKRMTYGKTYSHVFGADINLMEFFILKHKIMGPCWLEFKNVTVHQKAVSWCRFNLTTMYSLQNDCCVAIPDQDASPPLTIMSIHPQTKMNLITNKYEIVAVSLLVEKDADIDNQQAMTQAAKAGSRITYIRKPDFSDGAEYSLLNHVLEQERNSKKHVVLVENTEKSMIEALISKIDTIDPDIVVGHGFSSFTLDVLLNRMKTLKIQNWHKIGRLKFDKFPKLQAGPGGAELSSRKELSIMSGRIVCDTFVVSQTLIKSKSYDLTELARTQLHLPRSENETKVMSSAEIVMDVIQHCSYDAYLSFALTARLQILPLTKCLTNLSGNLWSHTMYGARLERVEYLLLHTFYERGYICPNNPKYQSKNKLFKDGDDQNTNIKQADQVKEINNNPKVSYEGGLVLDPIVGLYDHYVLLLDFNSLYPSIIQEYNVCLTTILRQQQCQDENVENSEDTQSTTSLPTGVLPELVKRVVEKRKSIKSKMKRPTTPKDVKAQLDVQQMAYKLTANSMYGCLGSSYSRFYAEPLAAFITRMGRNVLRSTVDIAKKLGLEVIYGDTDSVMINSKTYDIEKAKLLGEMLKESVNHRYWSLELEIDGIFRRTLLVKKKKYAALSVTYSDNDVLQATIEVKGLDMVRRDWCKLSHRVSGQVLQYILTSGLTLTSGKQDFAMAQAVYDKLTEVATTIEQNYLEDYIILQQLSKPLEEYNDSLMHVIVAKDMRRKWIDVKKGDVVPYIICKDKNKSMPHMPSDVRDEKSQIDYYWYLHKQILPPVLRICSPVKGIEEDELRLRLGIDKNALKKKKKDKINEVSDDESPDLVVDEETADVESALTSNQDDIESSFSICCPSCGHKNLYDKYLCILHDENATGYGLRCSECASVLTADSIINQSILAIRFYIEQYYSSNLQCSENRCSKIYRASQSFHINSKCLVNNCHGRVTRQFNESKLYKIISFFSSMFDTKKTKHEYHRKCITDLGAGAPHHIPLEQLGYHPMYDKAKKELYQFIELSAYHFINLNDSFSS
ncbi:MAG: hypothetical protein EXX96DRAFT_524211 [Benjaminiella poitrasii]|nr:MAG: hypothetical protein EXX96DRAFT_524211 [Benjaminiella poitrasii]